MIKDAYRVIGIMSGTSLDGIDLAHLTLWYDERWHFEIHAAETIPYSETWRATLKNLVKVSSEELKAIDNNYTQYLAETINEFMAANHIKELDAVCSHGHTALHQPENHFTYQIGNLPALAQLIDQTVVCNFRVADMKLGGQGAPLVPIGDQLLFPDYDMCINLGGFANCSSEENGKRIAYDICPVNIVLNHYAKLLGQDYDAEGLIAKSGFVHKTLLDQLNQLPFYAQQAPKSLGLEWVEAQVTPIIAAHSCSVIDVISTFTAHAAQQIAKTIKSGANVLFTGGGTYNDFLLSHIKLQRDFNLIKPSHALIDYKEALIFGLLGVLKLRNEVNCLASVTGAKQNHSSGQIWIPK